MLCDNGRSATFSDCRRYRYTLTKRWSDGPLIAWVALNPSTADEVQDDPTIRRMSGFAKQWNYGGLVVLNIFAYRATDPREMKAQSDPVGAGNLSAGMVCDIAQNGVELFVACWGAHGSHLDRAAAVCRVFDSLQIPLHCLGTTKDGNPKHPLYLSRMTKLERFTTSSFVFQQESN